MNDATRPSGAGSAAAMERGQTGDAREAPDQARGRLFGFVRAAAPGIPGGRLRALCLLVALCASGGALSRPAHAFRESTDRVPATGVVEIAFTPGDAADRLITETVLRARYQILVQAFSFTHRKIADALAGARRRGVDVQVIVDGRQLENGFAPVVPRLAGAGVTVFVTATTRLPTTR